MRRFALAVGRLRRALPLALASLTCAGPQRARAGNDEGILAGGQAALTAGAITATVSDGSASWYNPAGLARAERQTVDINASVYGISLITSERLFTLPDGTQRDASMTNWQLIPSTLSYVRRVNLRTVAAFSVIVPTTSDLDLRASSLQTDGTRFSLGIDSLRNEYAYILSTGVRVADDLRFGASLHGIYISSETMLQIGRGIPGDPAAPFGVVSSHSTLGDYGVRAGLGLQWTPLPQLDVGLSVQTPTLTGFRKTRTSSVGGGLSAAMEGAYTVADQDELDAVWELSTPFVLRLGVAYQLDGLQLMLDGSLYSPLDSSESTLDRRLSGNARAACLVTLSDELAFGIGGFTDLNGTRQPGPDYAGVAGGLRFAHHYHIAEGARPLTFLTTLAGRYAYGWGSTRGVSFEDLNEDNFVYIEAPIHVHELAFNLGGGVTF